jgi:small subunit ribosomal protein S20
MATHKSAEKANRQSIKRAAINKSRRTKIRTTVKALNECITRGDKDAAKKQFQHTQSEVARGVTKSVLKKNTASRIISKLAAKVKGLISANN